MSTATAIQSGALDAADGASNSPDGKPATHVLIADDDNALRTSLAFILQRFGFQVSVACNGQEALSLALAGEIDVLLLDLKMPVMSGVEVLTKLRRSPTTRRLPVLIFSQQSDRESVQQCVRLSVSGFLVKQALNVEDLVHRLETVAAAGKEQADEAQPADSTGETVADDEPAFDHQAWKQRATELGRVPREQAQQIVDVQPIVSIFPDEIKELHSMVATSKTNPQDLTDSIEQEPGLLLSVLDAANRSQESKTDASDVLTALHWVGNAGIETMVKMHLQQAVDAPAERRNWILRWWAHSVAVSQFAAYLAPAAKFSPETARVAGMLHDIGRLMLLTNALGDKAVTCYELARNMRIPTAAAEQVLLGLSHKQIGSMICRRFHVPADLCNVCDTHDFEDTARERLDDHNSRFSALICAADQLAKSHGFGGLPNDEILPIPQIMIEHLQTMPMAIGAVVAEIQTLTTWRVGGELPKLGQAALSLRGKVVELLTSNPKPGNPFLHALRDAGATVTARGGFNDLADAKVMCDLLLIDYTTENLVRMLPTMRRMAQLEHLKDTPQLLLARRSDEPETLLSQAGLDLAVYPTPIRINTLLQAIHRMT